MSNLNYFRGFELEPSDFILDVSKKGFMSRMAGFWRHWDDFPAHIKNAIWADVMVNINSYFI